MNNLQFASRGYPVKADGPAQLIEERPPPLGPVCQDWCLQVQTWPVLVREIVR